MTAGSYHHGSLHQAILDAAVNEARRSGPQGVQVRALAKTVGVSPAAVYRHVPSIEALLAEVAQAARQELAVRLTEQRDHASAGRNRKLKAQNRFSAIGRGYIEFALAEPHLFDTAFAPCTVSPPRPDDPSPWDVLAAGIQELVDAGVVPAAEADRAALIAWSGVHGVASILVRQAAVGPLDAGDAIDTVLDGIRRALETL
ncbi:MAG: TetR/AcrR family transcriptional regulator [Mycobacterium sp.]